MKGVITETNWRDEIISPGSERAILTACLNNNDLIAECENQQLSPEHFIDDANRYIYMAVRYLYEINQVPEPMAIMEIIADNKAKESIKNAGGLEYLTMLTKAPVVQRNVEIYIKKLKQTFTRRKLIELAEMAKAKMLDDASKVLNPSELVGSIQQDLDEVGTEAVQTDEVYEMGSMAEERLAVMAENPMDVIGLESGYLVFDKMTNGMQGGDLLFICARSKTGKSVWLTNVANKIAIVDQLPVLYIDTEMPSSQVETRLIAMNSGVPEHEIKNGMYTKDTEYGTAEEKIAKVKHAVGMIKAGKLYHVYMPNFTIEKVQALTRKYQMKYGIVALFFDYLKMPQANKNALKNAQEYQELGFMASALKDMAGILNIPVYSAVQANRSEAGKGFGSSDMNEKSIAGSDRILQLASKLCFLANKDEEEYALNPQNGNQELRIAFQRNGACDCPPINIMFHREIIRMEEI